MKKETIYIVLFVVLILIVLVFVTLQFNSSTSSGQAGKEIPTITMKQLPRPSIQIDTKKTYTAILKTSEGDIMMVLNVKQTTNTVINFIYLAKQKFYNNTIFHRVIKGFMIQGGDPNGDGTGGPGYRFDDETFEGEYTRGTVAMANAGPNTNGSQFFIIQEDNATLPKNYVIFGKVTKGLEVVDKIATAPVKANSRGESSVPVNPVKVLSIEITEK